MLTNRRNCYRVLETDYHHHQESSLCTLFGQFPEIFKLNDKLVDLRYSFTSLRRLKISRVTSATHRRTSRVHVTHQNGFGKRVFSAPIYENVCLGLRIIA